MGIEYNLLKKLDDYTPAKRDWLERERRRERPRIRIPVIPYWPKEDNPKEDKFKRGGIVINPDGTTEDL